MRLMHISKKEIQIKLQAKIKSKETKIATELKGEGQQLAKPVNDFQLLLNQSFRVFFCIKFSNFIFFNSAIFTFNSQNKS